MRRLTQTSVFDDNPDDEVLSVNALSLQMNMASDSRSQVCDNARFQTLEQDEGEQERGSESIGVRVLFSFKWATMEETGSFQEPLLIRRVGILNIHRSDVEHDSSGGGPWHSVSSTLLELPPPRPSIPLAQYISSTHHPSLFSSRTKAATHNISRTAETPVCMRILNARSIVNVALECWPQIVNDSCAWHEQIRNENETMADQGDGSAEWQEVRITTVTFPQILQTRSGQYRRGQGRAGPAALDPQLLATNLSAFQLLLATRSGPLTHRQAT
ncbi:hypothetical protein J6590_003195 [Homalodisca vitripennis]|nr:hypothetical protein J6590_003195 [Homalodisca vitripennis]